MSEAGLEVKLGGDVYRVVPQKIGRIRRKLTEAFSLLDTAAGEDAGEVEIDDQLYEALRVFIPDIAPKWRLLGYASAEAMEADSYDEAADSSPTGPELIEALQAIYTVNGGERIARLLGNVISPELIRAWIRTEGLKTLSDRSSSSPSPRAGAPSTSSTPPSPMPKPAASPSLASSTS